MNLETILTFIAPIGTAIVGFFAGKKRSDREIEQITLGNVEQALGIYKNVLDDMKIRYDNEIEQLKAKLKEYELHIEALEKKIKEFSTPQRIRKTTK